MKNKDKKSSDFKNQITLQGFKEKDLINNKNRAKTKRESSIPREVANRMARRIAITTGIPTISGMGVFVGSYYLITKGIADIAPVVTLVTSGGCFLIGLLGLSYGILSASWDKGAGSFLGFENIKPNISRMREAFKAKEITN